MEASSDIELRPGGEYQLSLGSPGGTGYTWEVQSEDPQGAIRVYPGPAQPPPAMEPSVSQTYGVDLLYIIEAVAPGRAEVRFSLRRPWERTAAPAQVRTLRVTVTPQ